MQGGRNEIISKVDAVAAYSNLVYPHKNARALRKLLTEAETSTRQKQSSEPSPARRLRQRLGSDVVDQMVADYRSGIPTMELADTYSISKHGVLTLLMEAGVALRRQPLTDEQVSAAAMLYEAGKSLAAVARELGVAQESLRRALVNSGIPMRIRGGSKSKNFLVTQP
jgi:lambda repressor-like predicted transcriptional regulator